MAHMKKGGNENCNAYLQKNGIGPRTPIKQKYESDVAQLYKEILKARVEGLPEPTVLVKKAPRQQSSGGMTGMGGGGGGGGGGGMGGGGGGGGMPNGGGGTAPASTDANGMERMAGETDQTYIARQTRLREEARKRMAAKFGGGGMMGGGGGRMQGVGSDPSYNPGGGGMGGIDMGSLYSGLKAVESTGASFWGSLTGGVSSVAQSLAAPSDGDFDGLADLQRQISSQKPSQSKYAGFGSETNKGGGLNSNNSGMNRGSSNGSFASNASSDQMSSGGNVPEATGLAGEDRNGIERLSGESDDQYVSRQTRLRDEAKARMAAKFGGGGMSGSGSAPASGNIFSSNSTSKNQSAPSSGNASKKTMNSNDFFSSFGS